MTNIALINRKESFNPRNNPNFERLAAKTGEVKTKFARANFKNRLSILAMIAGTLDEKSTASVFVVKRDRSKIARLLDELTEIHIELAAKEVTAKYKLQFPATAADFCRICAAENITILSDSKEYEKETGRKITLKIACIFSHPDFEGSFVTLNETLEGHAAADSMFTLLGIHFLHRLPGIVSADPFDELSVRQLREAKIFAERLVGVDIKNRPASEVRELQAA